MGWAQSLKRLRRSKWHRAAVAIVLAVNLAVLAALGLGAGVFEDFSVQAGDRTMPRGSTDERVVVAGVDNLALREVGDWPWSRDLQAELVNRLFDRGAAAVVLDVVHGGPSPQDDALAAALGRGASVIGVEASLENAPDPRRAPRAKVEESPPPPLAEAASGVGMVNVEPGRDGVVRQVPLMAELPTADLPSLSLAAFAAVEGLDGPIVQRPFGIEIGGRVIPTDDHKLLRVTFSPGLSPGEKSAPDEQEDVPFASAGEIMAGSSEVDLDGKIVLVGATAPLLQDFRLTPVAKRNLGLPGVFIHANALNTLLTGDFSREASSTETVAWVFVLAAVIGLLSWLAPLKFGVPLSFVAIFGWLLWSLARFEVGVIADFVYPPLSALAALIGGLVLRYLTEGKARRRVSALFAQYVPPAVAERLVNEDRVDSVMAGERLDVSVLFCDLRGFTAQAAALEPAQVRLLLDTYYERLSKLILDHGGTLMQYVGDEIYAAFGAPEIQSDHSARAVRCAVAMQDARPAIGEELAALGLPPIHYGIGVNSGVAVSAIVGSSTKSQYSLVGDTVNIGSRLCSQAREDHVCFPDHVREAAGEAVPSDIDDLGPIEFKNATRPIQVWRYWANKTPEAVAAHEKKLAASGK